MKYVSRNSLHCVVVLDKNKIVMLSYKYIIFYILLLLYDIVHGAKNECPNYCTCDMYFDLHRATCKNKQLISVEIGMSPAAEILDLSHNQISQLDKNIFLVSLI